MDQENRKSTGYKDNDGNEVFYGDKVRHLSGVEYVVTEENLKEIFKLSDSIGSEDFEGWEIVK